MRCVVCIMCLMRRTCLVVVLLLLLEGRGLKAGMGLLCRRRARRLGVRL